MDNRDKKITCREAREMDMVNYLSVLGHEPAMIRGNQFWYLPPLRSEKTPSFKVNRRLNRWYDFGMGKGGNLIDFAITYFDCTVGDFLTILASSTTVQKPSANRLFSLVSNTDNTRIVITCIKSLFHPALLDDLYERRITASITDRHCNEIHYSVSGSNYFAIGFKNDVGGYELRSSCFKGSSSPKAITRIQNGFNELAVFEGFMDFLSFLTITCSEEPYPMDFLVLNSLSFFEESFPLMDSYKRVSLYLDNDPAGQNCSLLARGRSSRFTDESRLYKNHKDLNDFLRHIGKPADQHRKSFLGPP